MTGSSAASASPSRSRPAPRVPAPSTCARPSCSAEATVGRPPGPRAVRAALTAPRRRPRTRLVTLNIDHGGGPRIPAITTALLRHAPDLVVLTEYRVNEVGARLLRRLAAGGLTFQVTSHPPSGVESVAVASCLPIGSVREPLTGRHGHRVLEVELAGLTLGAVYFPLGSATRTFWRDKFLALAATRIARPYCFAGDWNTGRQGVDEVGATFAAAREFEALTEAGWTDAWRVLHPEGRQYTWVSNRGEGFRVDHALLSPSLASCLRAAVISEAERIPRITDHAALVVDLDLA
ncbi:MAG: exodeoxyribonuclease III [Candidatus Limnocylindrales bacterium]